MGAAGTKSRTEAGAITVEEPQPRLIASLDALPVAHTTADTRAQVRRELDAANVKLAVIDDDPTGTQTVRDVPLVTGWDEDELAWAMSSAKPTFGVLTNARSLSEERASEINHEIGGRLAGVAQRLGTQVRVISRSDSTLRGHFPAEPEALAEGLVAGGERVDCVLVCPAFPEAGRVTVDDVHWVVDDGRLIPAAQTEYAQDAAFEYHCSNLLGWVRERAGANAAVGSISVERLRAEGPTYVSDRLVGLASEARYVVANAAAPSDLDVLALGVAGAEREGLRLICRTGPSFVSARAGQETAKPLSEAEIAMRGGRGLLVVGSHTALSTAQLEAARDRHELSVVMLDVAELLAGDRAVQVARLVAELSARLTEGDAALVTSRAPLYLEGGADSLRSAGVVADAMVEIVASVVREVPLQWLVAKGGITSHDLAVKALKATRVTVLGQLFAGQVSVWKLGESSVSPGLRYVVFPGNVGDESTLARALARLKGVE